MVVSPKSITKNIRKKLLIFVISAILSQAQEAPCMQTRAFYYKIFAIGVKYIKIGVVKMMKDAQKKLLKISNWCKIGVVRHLHIQKSL